MPTLKNAIPKYRKHRASGQAVVTIASVDHYLGPYGTKASKWEYDRLIGEWLTAGRPTAPVSKPHEITVSEVIVAFFEHARRYYLKNPKTAENFKPILTLVRQLYGRTQADEFGPKALKAIRERLVADGQSRNYVNDNIQRIKRMYRWATAEQLVSPHVMQGLNALAGLRKGYTNARETAPVMPVDDATVEATHPYLPPVVQAMVRLQRLTGARPAEICAIRPRDIERTGEVWKFTPRDHKTAHHGKNRVIFIGPKAQAILAPYLDRAPEAACFSPSDSERERMAAVHAKRTTSLSCGNRPGKVVTGRPKRIIGDEYDTNTYRRAIHRACEVAVKMPAELRMKNPKATEAEESERRRKAAEWRAAHLWAPNQLRHAAATDIRQRFGLEAAQVTLGHAKANITEVYAARDQRLGMQVAIELG